MKTSVVIVTYNRIELLKECIDCIKRQTVTPYELIIVDNASSDGTQGYLDGLRRLELSFNVRIIELRENKGGAYGFNKGIETFLNSESEWVVLIDDDAMLDDEFMKEITMAIENNKIGGALSGTVLENNNIAIEHRRVLTGFYNSEERPAKAELYNGEMFRCDIASFCGLVVNRELINRIGLPEKDFFISYDDTEYCMRIDSKSGIYNINAALINHKTKNDGNRHIDEKLKWREYYLIRNSFYSFIKHGNYVMLTKRTCRCLSDNVHTIFSNRISMNDKKYNLKLRHKAMHDGFSGNLGINPAYYP